MKILLNGAQGTGKSSIVKHYYTNLSKIDSISKIFMSNKEIQTDINNIDFIDFEYKITLYHLNNIINVDKFICSRGLADSYAYITYAYENSNNFNVKLAMSELLLLLERYIYIAKKMNIKHIYVPIKFKINQSNNNLRVVDEQYQIDIDSRIQKFFEEYKIDYRELNSISIDERIEEIMNYANC